jgi:hypothetical protein
VYEKDSKMRALIEAIADVSSNSELQKIQERISGIWEIESPVHKKLRVSSRSHSPSSIPFTGKDDFKSLLRDNFETKEEELIAFRQNDEKEIDVEEFELEP